MIWNKIKIFEIRKDAINSLFKDIRGIETSRKRIVIFYYYIFPLFISLFLVFLGVKIDKEIASYLITGISIFAGLFFNLLIVVSDKMKHRKIFFNSEKEHLKNYAELYKNFSEQLTAYISYSIVLSLILIGLIFLTQIDVNNINFILLTRKSIMVFEFIKDVFSFLVFYFGNQFLLILTIILSNMYIMLIDDINLEEK